MRMTVLAAALALAAAPALAQPTPPPPEDLPPPAATAPAPAQAPPTRMTGRQRFEMANVTHDGKLTREQAEQAHWNGVARHFDEIDHDRKGYITLQDLRDFAAARRAARQSQPPPQ